MVASLRTSFAEASLRKRSSPYTTHLTRCRVRLCQCDFEALSCGRFPWMSAKPGLYVSRPLCCGCVNTLTVIMQSFVSHFRNYQPWRLQFFQHGTAIKPHSWPKFHRLAVRPDKKLVLDLHLKQVQPPTNYPLCINDQPQTSPHAIPTAGFARVIGGGGHHSRGSISPEQLRRIKPANFCGHLTKTTKPDSKSFRKVPCTSGNEGPTRSFQS